MILLFLLLNYHMQPHLLLDHVIDIDPRLVVTSHSQLNLSILCVHLHKVIFAKKSFFLHINIDTVIDTS